MIDLSFATGEPILLKNADIREHRETRIGGAHLLSAERKDFSIYVQQLEQHNYAMLFRSMEFREETTINIFERYPGIRLEIVLSGVINMKYRNGQQFKLMPGQYLLSNQEVVQCYFRKDESCRYISFYYSPALLSQIGFSDPVFHPEPRPIPLAMQDLANEILINPHEGQALAFYYYINVPDILFKHVSSPLTEPTKQLSKEQTALIYQADNFLNENMDKSVTVKDLEKYTRASAYILNKGFIMVFGKSIIERQMNRRWERAKYLLERTSKPLKEIAGLTGFETMGGFITQFRKHFDITPSDWRDERSGL